MKIGNLVENKYDWGVAAYKDIHGLFAFEWQPSDLAIVLDSGYSSTNQPYIRILTSAGNIGWVRYDKVRILHR